ncbi:hypothetical protein B0H13DRAFT_1896993 [Mycena leptocephala]|nr:hypothetical protein B0H13DRAFT_1896993 [Mycena leptocephala]
MANAPHSPTSALASQLTMPVLASMGFMIIPFPMVATAFPIAPNISTICAPAPAASSPATPPMAANAAKSGPAAPPKSAGAGLPSALLALLRDSDGPFFANQVFKAPPAESLAPVEEEVPAPEWYAIFRGRFVGVVDQYLVFSLSALADLAISGVTHSARKAYTTQSDALHAFNQALEWGGIQVA